MKKRLLRGFGVFALFLLFTRPTQGSQQPAPLFGHLLTPTSYLLEKKQVTFGNFVLGYGLSDQFSVATSPWLLVNYNMLNVVTRLATSPASGVPRLAVEFNYFKTVPMLFDWYTQESLFTRVTSSFSLLASYTLHLSAGYQYFRNYERPFSLRLNPGDDSPHTLSASTLNEVHLTDHIGMFLEAGVLGLNYYVPYLHLGASLFWQETWGLLQLGASRSSNVTEDGPFRIWHPEVQFQVYL